MGKTENNMGNDRARATILPELLPEYTIARSQEAPFEVVWEELQGMDDCSASGGKADLGTV